MKKSYLAVILGIIFIGIAVFYWITPAGSLPTYVPGFIAGSSTIHVKHGIASFILALILFVYAWFTSAPKESN